MTSEMNINDLIQQCMNAITNVRENLPHLNIIVAGKSGVGKSTLINSLFRNNFADTGIGRPVTKSIRKTEKKNYPLTIYDTPGLELSQEQQTHLKEEIIELINEGLASQDIKDSIHCLWYCINANGSRIEQTEIDFIRNLTETNRTARVPVIVLLTQAYAKQKTRDIKDAIEKENLSISKVIPLLAKDVEIDEDYVAKSYGLDTLLEVMSEELPNELLHTLQNVQKASIKQKNKYALTAVGTAATASAAEAAVPVPFSDAALLIPTQITMIATITAIYGIELSRGIITSIISSTIGSAGATVLGKALVANILKLIPAAGSVIGGTISAATAAALTSALGEAYIIIMEMIYKGQLKKEILESKEGQEIISKVFKERLGASR